jgi:urease accessory protein
VNVLALLHEESGAAAGLLAGLVHPVSGLDHVLAMLAVGVWGAQLGAPYMWALPVAFPLVMAFGGAVGVLGVHVMGVEIGIALSALVLGLLVLGQVRPRPAVAVAVVGLFALFHGHAHGTELPEGASGTLYSVGFVVATGTLHALGIVLGLANRFARGQIVLRVVGALVALGGCLFLWRALA